MNRLSILVALACLIFADPAAARSVLLHPGGAAASPPSYPAAVVSAGAQLAWDTIKTCGPDAGTSFAAASTLGGAKISKSPPNFSIAGGTHNWNAVDFSGANIFEYGGANVSITNAKFRCNSTPSCTTGYSFITQGYDASFTPTTGSALDIEKSTIDGTGRWAAQQLIQPAAASSLTIGYSCLTHAREDYVGTGKDATLVLKNDYFSAMGVGALPGDHNEMVHFYGTTATITDTFFDGSRGGTIVGANVLLFLDSVHTPKMAVTIDRCVFLHDGKFLYVIQVGGVVRMSNSVLQKGVNGHYISGLKLGVNFIDGGNNRDYATGAVIRGAAW